MSSKLDYDVLIIGASFAGSCLARQLRIHQPDLRVAQIEKRTEFDHWVGESTTEPWEDYATRVLRLGAYLEKHHIVKHGLRFFFDSEDKSLTVKDLSEVGRHHLLAIPARQLDRAQFDTDMVRMNRELGVDVYLGTRVYARGDDSLSEQIKIDPKNGHEVVTDKGSFTCRYLVDASGRSGVLARRMGIEEAEDRHPVGSYWCRYEGIPQFDDLGDEEWERRVNFSPRHSSTNHFMYRDYWIWYIALSDKVASLGVVWNRKRGFDLKLKNAKELDEFFRSHRAVNEAVGDAKVIDFHGLRHFPRRVKEFYSKDRWYLTGMAASFTDPLGSPQCVLVAQANRFIGTLIKTDREEGDGKKLRGLLKHFNVASGSFHESILSLWKDYARLGSYDVFAGFYTGLNSKYWNSTVPAALNDYAFLKKIAEEHGDSCECKAASTEVLSPFSGTLYRLTDEFVRYLDEKGEYYTRNKGQFLSNNAREAFIDKARKPRELSVEAEEDLITYEIVCRHFLGRMAEIEGVPFTEERFQSAFERKLPASSTLADMFSKLARAT